MTEAATLLLVDDEQNVRDLLSAALQVEPYVVTVCSDAEEALKAVSHSPADVAVVDVMLPGMDGLELCQRLQAQDGTAVILITGDERHYSYADAVASGAADFIVKPIKINELMLRVNKALDVKRTRESRDRLMCELKRLVITDGLTGLNNSRCFFEQLETELARGVRYGRVFSLLMIDVDSFKTFNDRFGHQEGDRALRAVAAALRAALRTADTAFRYGGEEFAVLLPETAAEAALAVAERLRQAVAGSHYGPRDGTKAPLSISVGVAEWGKDESKASLLARADKALYASKHKGRNRITFSEP